MMDIPAPFRLTEVTVSPQWTDYNHHLTESAYLLIMGESSDAFFRFFGIDDAYRAAGHSLYTVETHLRNLREAHEGERLSLTIQVLGTDAKRLHILHEMHSATGGLVATAEQMLLHVDTRAGRSARSCGISTGKEFCITPASAPMAGKGRNSGVGKPG